MRDWYDNPTEQDAIQEQATVIPNGPLGTLLQPEIKVEGDIPDEAKDLFQRYISGELGSIELMTELENLKRKINEDGVLRP